MWIQAPRTRAGLKGRYIDRCIQKKKNPSSLGPGAKRDSSARKNFREQEEYHAQTGQGKAPTGMEEIHPAQVLIIDAIVFLKQGR
jgi:hypothetical protein